MQLLFLHGLPASGKLTVGKELSSITGYPLFHNHLTVDLLLSVFQFGTAAFIKLREEIWLSVIEQASVERLPGLIFTFAPESSVRETFFHKLYSLLDAQNDSSFFVKLTCPVEVLRGRLGDSSRERLGKITSLEMFDKLNGQGVFAEFECLKLDLTIDSGKLSPAAAAAEIALRSGAACGSVSGQ